MNSNNIINNIIEKMDDYTMREFVIHNLDSDFFYDNFSRELYDDEDYYLKKKSRQVYFKIWNGIYNALPGVDEVLDYDEVMVGKIANVLKGIVAYRAILINGEVKVFFRDEVIDSFVVKGMGANDMTERIGKSMDKCDVLFFEGCQKEFGYFCNKVIVK